MSVRELVVLGTASQSPTRHRAHNAYLLRWDGQAILFDPGEGAQRQFTFAGVSPATVNRICLTHFHGDHCLGLPGILLRLSLDQVRHPVHLHYPASGEPHLHHLRHASIGHDALDLYLHPVHEPGVVHQGNDFTLRCAALRHRVPAIGWRLEEPVGRRIVPERLEAFGLSGPPVGVLQAGGTVTLDDGRAVTLDDVSEERPGQVFAFVMDTSDCDGARELAEGADLLVIESTFLSEQAELAASTGHLTAAPAAQIAADCGVGTLVITHFSTRYGDDAAADQRYLDEASAIFPDVVVAHDFDRIPVPRRG